MSIGLSSDMVNFNTQLYGGFLDTVVGNIDVFNEQSYNILQMSTMYHKGFLVEDAFFTDDITIRDRDPNSVSAATNDSIAASQVNSVKLYRYNRTAQTLQSFRNQFPSSDAMEEIMFTHGQKLGRKAMLDWRETALAGLQGVFGITGFQSGNDQLVHDISQEASGGVFGQTTLMDAMPLMGDQGGKLRAIIMHPNVYWPLVKDAAQSLSTPSTADFAVQTGLPQTLGLPIVVVNSASLVDAGGGADGQDAYFTYVLVDGAVTIDESERPFANVFLDNSLENSVLAIKTETAFTIGVKGVSYTGADHPANAALATNTNWAKAYSSKYDLMGIMIKSVAQANDAT